MPRLSLHLNALRFVNIWVAFILPDAITMWLSSISDNFDEDVAVNHFDIDLSGRSCEKSS